ARRDRHPAAGAVRERDRLLPVPDRAQPGGPTMAMTSRKPSLLWSRLHFALRFLGVTGAACAAVGLAMIQPARMNDLISASTADSAVVRTGGLLLFSGAGVAAFALVFELINALAGVAGQRSAFGFNAVAQVVLAVLLLVAVNLISTGWRLPEEVRPTRP